jgi:hypothetical protein
LYTLDVGVEFFLELSEISVNPVSIEFGQLSSFLQKKAGSKFENSSFKKI